MLRQALVFKSDQNQSRCLSNPILKIGHCDGHCLVHHGLFCKCYNIEPRQDHAVGLETKFFKNFSKIYQKIYLKNRFEVNIWFLARKWFHATRHYQWHTGRLHFKAPINLQFSILISTIIMRLIYLLEFY